MHYALPPSIRASSDAEIIGDLPDLTTLDPLPGGATTLELMSLWLEQLTSEETAERFPNLVAVNWFK